MPGLTYTIDGNDRGFLSAIDRDRRATQGLDQQMDRMGRSARRNTQRGRQGFDQMGRSIKKVGGLVAGAFAADKLKDAGLELFKVNAEFEKMETVLATTFGDKNLAEGIMMDINEFASKTPFQIDKLTASYIKLANQGFAATKKELTSLGDLSSSTGKDFDQLAEAVIDAQVGEFERLKEFGVRAKKQGDQVTFSFKGVQKQVAFNEKAIRSYLVSLGDLEGVSGSMANISETMAGKQSNLEDSWTLMKKKIGDELKPAFLSALELGSKGIDFMGMLVDSSWPVRDALDQLWHAADPLREALGGLAERYGWATDEASMATGVMDALGTGIEVVSELFGFQAEILGGVVDVLADVWDAFAEVTGITDNFGDNMKNVWLGIKTYLGMAADFAKSQLGGLGDMIIGVIEWDKDKIKAGFERMEVGVRKMGDKEAWTDEWQSQQQKDRVKAARKAKDQMEREAEKARKERLQKDRGLTAAAAYIDGKFKDKKKPTSGSGSSAKSAGLVAGAKAVQHITFNIQRVIGENKIITQHLPAGVNQTTNMLQRELVGMVRNAERILGD